MIEFIEQGNIVANFQTLFKPKFNDSSMQVTSKYNIQ